MIGDEKCRFLDADHKLREETWNIEQYRKYIEGRGASVTVATQVFDQGVNIPTMHAMIPAGGIKKYRPIIQRMGRVMRPKEGDKYCYIFDFWHTNHPWLRAQSKHRAAIYKREKIPIHWGISDIAQHLGPPPGGVL